MVIISDALLYVSFSLLMGLLIFELVPRKYRPAFRVSNRFFFGVVGSVMVLTLVPVISVTSYIVHQFEANLFHTFQQILFSYSIGHAWLVVMLFSCLLLFTRARLNQAQVLIVRILPLICAIAIVFAASWASHAASLEPLYGFLANSLHFLAVTVWIGIMLVVSWFSTTDERWLPYLRWYTPVAISCVAIIILSGFALMSLITPEYVNSWVLTYGQLLLLKHLLFIPLLMYGLINGFLMTRKLKQMPTFSPKKWLRAEAVIALAVFVVTAVMTEQTPPHDVARTLQFEQPSALFLVFHELNYGDQFTIGLSSLSIGFMVLAVILLMMIIRRFKRNGSARLSLVLTACFLLSSYTAVMTSVESSTLISDDSRYETMEDAIRESVAGEPNVLQSQPYKERYTVVLYEVNQELLVTELLLNDQENGGYYRLQDSTLTVGGIPISESDHKIRTFKLEGGLWVGDKDYTYVTIGFVNEPAHVADVVIHYEGAKDEVEIINQSFLNIATANEEWDPNHPIEFVSSDGEVIGGYMRGVMEQGVYCH
ncbi:copper resistance D family protein [Desertibacillus haloalkaliphilus]|uniref:copper resistance D family protein n=1 Tax=Desertibacillus haloalkaliphilus TaxID=1328930 RepID=UPI001C27FD5A|nr:CopD family protein [Desertibacillus haloalkaliphilus]MBU8907430.1 CopD family protein [Desertibacillus haloalkaliphilus]